MAKKSSRNYRRYYYKKSMYKKYVALYEAKAQFLSKKGYSMHDSKGAYTYTQYKTAVIKMRNTLKGRRDEGKIKRIPDVLKALVNDQAYKLSEEQAYAIFDFIKENREKYDIDVSFIKNINSAIMKIRQGEWLEEDVGLYTMIKDYRREAFAKYNELAKTDPDKLAELYAALSSPDEEINSIAGLVRKEVSRTFYGSP